MEPADRRAYTPMRSQVPMDPRVQTPKLPKRSYTPDSAAEDYAPMPEPPPKQEFRNPKPARFDPRTFSTGQGHDQGRYDAPSPPHTSARGSRYTPQLVRRPMLRTFVSEDIRTFLRRVTNYDIDQEASGYGGTNLRGMLDETVIAGMHQFMQLYGLSLPVDPKAKPTDPDSLEFTQWDCDVRAGLYAALNRPVGVCQQDQKAAHALIRRSVRWDITLPGFHDTFSEFCRKWNSVINTHGLRPQLLSPGKASTATIKLLTSLLYPEGYRAIIDESARTHNIRDVDQWFVGLISTEREYNAMIRQRSIMKTSGHGPSNPKDSHRGRNHVRFEDKPTHHAYRLEDSLPATAKGPQQRKAPSAGVWQPTQQPGKGEPKSANPPVYGGAARAAIGKLTCYSCKGPH